MKKNLRLFLIFMVGFVTARAQLNESFNGTTFPPAGWTSTLISDGDGSGSGIPGGVWQRATSGANPTATPHSGAGMAFYNSYNFDPTSQADLVTPALDFGGSVKRVSFWMYRSFSYSNQDSVSVYVNTTNSTNGATFLGRIARFISNTPAVASEGWYQYYFDIPVSYTGATNYVVFRGTGQFGLNMYIDDIVVATPPACKAPTVLSVSNYNNGAGTATATWSAAPGSPAGYEWAVNTTGVAPASGTTVSGITVTISGITSGVNNYVYVRSVCGSGSFSSWMTLPFAALPCVTLTTPADGASNVAQTPSFTWLAVASANSYNFYLGTSLANAAYMGSTTGTSASLSLLPSTLYYWYVVPVSNGVAGPVPSCIVNKFTTGLESTTPLNNPCSGAITINPTNIAGNAISATTAGASQSLESNLCLGYLDGPDDDVWFQFNTTTTTPTGTLTISPALTGGIFDIVAQVYAAKSCANLTDPVLCVDATIDNLNEVVNLSLLSPNTHYYMRVYSYSNSALDKGAFTITASAINSLPVMLTSFTANPVNKANVLNWVTQIEVNASHFIIERSRDGIDFANIGRVEAAGNSSGERSYSFTDIGPQKGKNYYRLKMVDNSNAFKLSDVRRVLNVGAADVSIYPNPVVDKLNVAIITYKQTDGQLTITDISGKTVYSGSVKLLEGNTTLPLSLGNIASGSYIIKIQLDDAVIVRKFTRQ